MADPGLSMDTCYYFDQGHPKHLSPDIRIVNNGGTAQSNTTNLVDVTVHRKVDGTCTSLPIDDWDVLNVDLFVCDPSASPFSPNNTTKVLKILNLNNAGTACSEVTIDKTLLAAGNSRTERFRWKIPHLAACYPPTVPALHDAEKPDHKCLVARVYPNILTPDPLQFHVMDDEHYAQRNICIDFCTSPCGINLWTGNEMETPRTFSIRVIHDLNPSRQMQEFIATELRQYEIGFETFAKEPPPKGFNVQFKDFPNAKIIVDKPPMLDVPPPVVNDQLEGCSRLIQQIFGGRRDQITPQRAAAPAPRGVKALTPQNDPLLFTTPSLETQIQLEPGQISDYFFETDLDGVNTGTIHLFHVFEVENAKVAGGVTIVMIKR